MAGYHLETNDLKGLSKYIKSGDCQNIALMLGAGVSTSAGIPDFRSPGTGLYANLARLKLPYPEAVFEINFFRNNPIPFYTLAHELYPGKFRPTLTHAFIRLLSEHSLLSMCFTQNIDTLERRAGVPESKIIEAHGSFATQRCIKCKTPFDDAKIKEMVLNFSKARKVPKCERPRCGGLVKPDIVFFGEALPPTFSKSPSIIRNADLLIVIGTSLTVHPFASLAEICPDDCPRVLINIDLVGDFGDRDQDVVLLGKCDEVIKELCEELGWEKELMKLWEETASSTDATDSAIDSTTDGASSVAVEESRSSSKKAGNEMLEAAVAKLAERIEKQMALGEQEATESGSSENRAKDSTSTSISGDKARASVVPEPRDSPASANPGVDEPVTTTAESAPDDSSSGEPALPSD